MASASNQTVSKKHLLRGGQWTSNQRVALHLIDHRLRQAAKVSEESKWAF